MNPNDNQQIGTIIKLNDGYVLNVYGQTIACRTERELGTTVARLAKRGRKANLEMKSAPPTPTQPEVVPARPPDQREQLQLGNLHKMIQARLAGEMTEEELMDATLLACPDLDRERVVATVQQVTEQYFGMAPPDPSQESPIGPKCACPACKMNQSTPNHLGMCVSCFKGEHLHPRPGEPSPSEPAPAPAPVWWTQEDEDEDEPDASAEVEAAQGATDSSEGELVPAAESGPGNGAYGADAS